jgi:hypothetical protein
MPEWWTYTLSDFILFSPRTYYRMIERHNLAMWPGQLVTLGLGLVVLTLLFRPARQQGRIVAVILALLWAWVAWVFLWNRYATINWAATYFAWAFALEVVLLVVAGVVRGEIRFRPRRDPSGIIGIGLFILSLAVYPLLPPLIGRGWRQAEIFGIVPDPTAIGTLGLLLLAEGPLRRSMMAVPIFWCVISGATLWAIGSPEGWMMTAAAILALGSLRLSGHQTLHSAFLVVLILAVGCTGDDRQGKAKAGLSQPTVCTSANRLAGRDSASVPEVSPAALEAHLRVLADDSLRGRGTGTSGHDLAARYVAACFAGLGLEPAGTREYMQPVPLLRARAVEGSSLTLHSASGARELVLNRDYVATPDFLRPNVEVTAPMVLAGFGVTAADRKYDDYQGVNARGKIVVLLTGAPRSFPPTARAHYATTRIKARNAVDHGAVGVLIVRTRDQTFPWDRLVRQQRAVGLMRWLDSTGAPRDVFPELRGIAGISDTAAGALFQGAPKSLAQVLSAAEAGTPPAFDLPVRATIRTVSTHERLESPNVAGLMRGSDSRLRNEVVVFSAHLDHLGIGVPVAGDSIYNGALDNASGSAALMEIARVFSGLAERPRRSVLFLAVTGEEMGLLGSDYFAEHPTVPIETIVADLNIDGLSLLYPLREMVPMGAEHSTLGSTVERAAKQIGVELGPDPFPQEVYFVRSDQYSFVRRGVPSLFLFMGIRSDSGVDAPGRLREWLSTRYHTPQDDLGQPLDFKAGARHAQLNVLVGLDVANADTRPRWKAGDFFGTTFSRGQAASP